MKLKSVLYYSLLFIIFGIFGYFMGKYALIYPLFDKEVPVVLELLFILFFTYLTFYIQIIIHEAGHLVFGLLSKYEFVSFRIGSLTLIKEDNKFKFKKFSLAGTGGQCLLSPPDFNDGKYPYVLYNLGGVLFNIFAMLLFLLIILLFKPKGIIYTFSIMMILTGFLTAILNGIPFKSELVSNDGYNALNLSKDKDALKAFWSTLKINALTQKGIRLKDLDEDYFKLSDDADLKNNITTSVYGMKENRYMDKHDFINAREIIDLLLSDKCDLNGINKNLLILDRLYIDIIEKKEINIDEIIDKGMKAFMKSMKNFPSIIRTQYLLGLYNHDKEKENEALERFKKIEKTYPNIADLVSEKELMEYAKENI